MFFSPSRYAGDMASGPPHLNTMLVTREACLVIICPGTCTLLEMLLYGSSLPPAGIKWLLVWAVGFRLLVHSFGPWITSGGKLRPSIGAAAIGCLALATFFVPGWRPAAAFCGAIFYFLNVIVNIFSPARLHIDQRVLILADIIACLLLVLYLVTFAIR